MNNYTSQFKKQKLFKVEISNSVRVCPECCTGILNKGYLSRY